MPYTIADFRRDYVKEHLRDLTPEERLEGLAPEERLKGLSAEEIERYLKELKARRSPRRRSSSPKERP
jgi:ribosomal protein L29